MDRQRFTNEATGQLVPTVPHGRPDVVLIPDPLPPKQWQPPNETCALVVEANKAIAKLDGQSGLLPNPHIVLSPIQRQEALRSSSLEGTYATPQQLLLFELRPLDVGSEDDEANDWPQVSNYIHAMNLPESRSCRSARG